jgi:hypothetical protein
MEKVKAAGANGMSQTAIHNAFGNNKSAGTIKRALSLLQQRETVQMLKPSTTGKPITIWKEACAG